MNSVFFGPLLRVVNEQEWSNSDKNKNFGVVLVPRSTLVLCEKYIVSNPSWNKTLFYHIDARNFKLSNRQLKNVR